MIGGGAAPVEGLPDDGAGTTAAADAIGPYQRTDDELLTYLGNIWREAWDSISQQRTKRTTDWKMLAGDQWEAEDQARAKAQKRPALTLNLLISIIAAVEGEERTNRQELKFYGDGQEDDGAAYGMNRILKWIMDQCGGEFALSSQFKSLAVCGEGWVVPDMDFFEDPEGKLRVLFVDDEEMFDDPLARDPASEDSRYCHRVRYMAEDEGEARWPGFREKVMNAAGQDVDAHEADGAGYRDVYSAPGDTKSLKLYDAKNKHWAITETWWFQIEPGWVVVDEATGMLVEKSDEEMGVLRTQREQEQKDALAAVMAGTATFAPPTPPPANTVPGLDAAPGFMPAVQLPSVQMPKPLQAKQRPLKRLYLAHWVGKALLEKQPSPLKDLKRIPYVPARGIYDKVKREWFGLVRPLVDPQRQHNVEQSAIIQMMQLQPKSAWMGPKGSFHNKAEWQTKVSQPGAMLEYNASRGKPEPIPTPAIPRHLIDMAFTRPQTMREISGVNVEMTGQRVASDPGVVMEQRQKAARTVLAPLFDNYRMSKKALGKVLLAYIQTYISPGRRMRVMGPEGPEYVEMTEQMQLGRYDLNVEETNSTVNDRIATLNIMQTTLPQMAKAGVPIPPSLIDLLPMQPHIRDEWKRMMSWQLLISGQMPPDGWQPGMPDPRMLPPPGMSPGAPPAPPAPAPAI